MHREPPDWRRLDRRAFLRLSAGSALGLAAACNGEAPSLPATPAPAPRAAITPPEAPAVSAPAEPPPTVEAGPLNVLVITVDTLRADYVGSYGGPAQTPAADRLAAQGVRFSQAYAQLPQTTPNHASLFTGQFPSTHGLRITLHNALPAGAVTLAQVLRAEGYRTGAVYSWFSLDGPASGLDQGFETYQNVTPPDAAKGRADAVTDAATEWLEAAGSAAPFFLWAHYRDPHYPYVPTAPYDALYVTPCDGCVDGSAATLGRIHEGWQPSPADRDRILGAYAGEVTLADHQIGRLLDRLEALNLAPRTLVVYTSDHGEAFGEHEEWFHGIKLHQPTIHIPLLMRLPGVIPAGSVVNATAQTIDIMPTVLDYVGLPAAPSVEGRGVRAAIEGHDLGDHVAIAEVADWRYSAVVGGAWKLIQDNLRGDLRLHHLPTDPQEQRNRATAERPTAAALKSTLEAWQRTRERGQLWQG
jgi:arylsulfatase A-like enzyme